MTSKVRVRVKITSNKLDDIKQITDQISQLANATESTLKVIPLPKKKLRINCRKTPCGDGSDTYEHWELRFYNVLVELLCDEKVLRQLLRIRMPDNVQVRLKIS
ncbi:MAG: 30S ribosomal protein S10 [Candidatus Anstonellales archaeon]